MGLHKPGELDHEVVRDAVFDFGRVLKRCVGAFALLETSDGVVFELKLAPVLGVGTFGEAEDVTRVDARFPTFTGLSAALTQLRSTTLTTLATFGSGTGGPRHN